MSQVFITTAEELLTLHPTKIFTEREVVEVPRCTLIQCAALMVKEKNLPVIKFKHHMYPRTSGVDRNGRGYGPDVLVVNTTVFPVKKDWISVGPEDIGVGNHCVSLSSEGIIAFRKEYNLW